MRKFTGHDATDMALPATVEITPIAAATDPKGPRMFLREFISQCLELSPSLYRIHLKARAAGANGQHIVRRRIANNAGECYPNLSLGFVPDFSKKLEPVQCRRTSAHVHCMC